MKKRVLSVSILCLILTISIFTQTTSLQQASAWGCDEAGQEARADFYARNNISSYFDPCSNGGQCAAGSGTLTGPAPTELSGADNVEKVWNYFIGRGLTPIAAAGAMGNIEQESGFNPWIGESGSTSINKSDQGSGFGLIQWTNPEMPPNYDITKGRRYRVLEAMEKAGINLASVDQNDQAQTDTALLMQLNWLWDGEYGKMTWQEQTNIETKIDGDTNIDPMSAEANISNGTTLYFHAAVERSNDSPSMLQERIDGAKAWLDKFGGGGPGGDCSSNGTTDIVEMAKKVQDGAMGLQRMDGLKRGIKGLDCGDCVAFVTTVYAAAGYPKPFNGDYDDEDSGIRGPDAGPGNGSNLPSSGYAYDSSSYEIIPNSEKKPGDILAWDTHVAIYAGGQNAYEGGGGPGSNPSNTCNIGNPSWYSVDSAEVLRYKGEPIK